MTRVLRPVPLTALIALAALVALLAYGIASRSPSTTIDDQLARGERVTAPAISWPTLAGAGPRVPLSAYRGKVVLLNFWASWCGPCRGEARLLERWQTQIQPRGGTIVGVDVLDVSGDATAFARSYGLTYPLLRDRDGSQLKPFGVLGYPETVVVDRRGRIAATRRGPVDERFLTTSVLPLLKERA